MTQNDITVLSVINERQELAIYVAFYRQVTMKFKYAAMGTQKFMPKTYVVHR